jgi:amino acid transporter
VRALLGRPLASSEASKEEINPVEGLSAMSLDALTSVAYGPEAILLVLIVAGTGALHLILPITVAIVILLALLVTSYRQVIDAYPQGGGAYAVARDTFGPLLRELAGAALIVDYTLTVAVSIAAGVAALTSAFPALAPGTLGLCLGILLVITTLNLRGAGESARAFLAPTLLFVVGLLAIIVVGLIHPLGSASTAPPIGGRTVEAVSVLLILKAFSAGCSALTGVEAIANGVPLFKAPRAARAKLTELLLGLILGAMLLGLSVLANRFHTRPRAGETVLSQIMAQAVGRHWAYYIVSITLAFVLALAANTSFSGLPILSSLLARDNYLPHFFGVRDHRLVFGNGVLALALSSGLLLVAVNGNTNTLIPLFAIGVFTGFTVCQSGLVVHWRRTRGPGWARRAAVNGVGAVVTAVATVIFIVTKFTEGAWVVVVVIPALILLFRRIAAYYAGVRNRLAIGTPPERPRARRTTVVVPVTNVSRLTAQALSEALSLGDEVLAVTVVLGADGTQDPVPIEEDWARWDPGVELSVIRTDYSSVVQPLVDFVDEVRARGENQVVVLIPMLIPEHAYQWVLHNQIDLALSAALRRRPDVVVARVPMALPELDVQEAQGDGAAP